MNLALVHYHLNRGGVASVIANQIRALGAAGDGERPSRIAVLYGGRRIGWPDDLGTEARSLRVGLAEVPGLDYDAETGAPCADLARRLIAALRAAGFDPAETVVHVHNHSLGKNVALPEAVGALARAGYALLLQIHDFAEDYRPANYRALARAIAPAGSGVEIPAVLYPQASHIHYAVLNHRDQAVLEDAGVDRRRVHTLPNPALPPRAPSEGGNARERVFSAARIPGGSHLLLYPGRCIRRKNIGEALLWAALGRGDYGVGFTLAPINPLEQPQYRRWRELAARLELPCYFELGSLRGLSLDENFAAADFALSTSVAEGFGLVFLEPWLHGRALVGRDLPEITADFRAAGLLLDRLEPALWIPTDWVAQRALEASLTAAYRRVLDAYGRPADDGAESALASLAASASAPRFDFGRLSSTLQSEVLVRVSADPRARDRVLELNPRVGAAILAPGVASAGRTGVVQANAQVVETRYSLRAIGAALVRVYRDVVSSSRDAALHGPQRGEAILETFLEPSRFFPIRVET